jgi:hypothetical protein
VRDAEVGELDERPGTARHGPVGNEDVVGLDVPVHDAGLMRGGESGGHLRADGGGVGGRQGAVLIEDAAEAAGGQVLQDQPGLAVLEYDVEDRDDVRVMQRGGDPGLAHRSFARERRFRGR